MQTEHPHRGAIWKQHASEIAQRRSAIHIEPGHTMTAAFVAARRGTAGHEQAPLRSLIGCNGSAEFCVLERVGAERGNLLERCDLVDADCASQAILPVSRYSIELMAKDPKRQRFETCPFGRTNEGENLVINRHRDTARLWVSQSINRWE